MTALAAVVKTMLSPPPLLVRPCFKLSKGMPTSYQSYFLQVQVRVVQEEEEERDLTWQQRRLMWVQPPSRSNLPASTPLYRACLRSLRLINGSTLAWLFTLWMLLLANTPEMQM